ncbi:MAG: 1-deoxy-D-xylulose-5-phosphate synthase [Oscillospiraceae bacterium]|nr:1-deoxy-D-xylulose-5-phosphate synthase [Oscillospiraceae bacterium]
MILDSIHSPADVKALSAEQVNTLCREIREFLVESVSKTGGHLASNLGAVELTVAIHRVFDTANDRLVFDVGHQCYVHKILTGRKEQFPTLRQFGGISGFPKPKESVHDAFIAGHASNSVSVALGMARARTMQKKDYSVLALIGDGALTGGLAYEGLNNLGASDEPVIVMLNDNGMSINKNVGAVSGHLSSLRVKPGYYTFKKHYRRLLQKTAAGRAVYRFNHRVKTAVKKALLPHATMFEDMGFTYMGPVDGHNVEQMETVLRWAKEANCPVLVHILTEKGKGYAPAEENPGAYHGVSPFDASVGVKASGKANFSSVFGDTLCDLAKDDERICAITAAMEDGTGLTKFAKQYPKRFFDVGIAESHAAAMAAGLAKQGAVPVFAVYSSFLQRAYDQLLHDVALGSLHAVFAVDRAGLVGADGETHHGAFDPVFLTGIPHMSVLCPSNFAELRTMLRRAIKDLSGPVAVRFPRGSEGAFTQDTGEKDFAELSSGEDITLCAYGTMINEVLGAAKLLGEQGITARVVKINRISHFEGAELVAAIGQTKRLLIAEECSGVGCIGQRIAAMLTEENCAPQHLVLCNLGDGFVDHGTQAELLKQCGLDAASIAARAAEVCHEG